MSNSEDAIDFAKFHSKQEELEQKIDKFSNFASFIGGLLLGAILSFPLQLFLRPLSYDGTALTYGPGVLIDPAPIWVIPLISLVVLIGVILVTLAGYVGWLGIVGQETVKLSYEFSDHDSFYEELRDYLDKEARFVDVEVKAKQNWIKCSDPNRQPDPGLFIGPVSPLGMSSLMELMIELVFPKTIIKLEFDPELSVVELRYDPSSENAIHLLEKLESRY
jgi:hypothetical protein